MYTDRLRDTLRQIEEHCTDNRIPVFRGAAPQLKWKRTASWEGQEPSGWKDFLGTLSLLGTKMLHVEMMENEPSDETEEGEMLAYGNSLEGKAREAWAASHAVIQQTAGYLSDITLTFFHEGFAYQWTTEAEWSEHFERLLPASIQTGDDQEEEEEIEEPAPADDPEAVEKKEEILNAAARTFLTNEEYLACEKVNDRRSFVVKTLWNDDKTNRQELFRIAARAETLFKTEVESKRDEATIEKIKELRRQQPGLKKTIAGARLKMTDREINRFWHLTEPVTA